MSQIATVKSITGTAFVVGLDGQTRPLKAGDKIQKGETIVTSADGRVELDMEGGGQPLAVGPAQTVKVEDSVAEATRPAPQQASTASGTIDSVVQALEQGGDLNQQLEATAAGAGGGGGEGGGSGFVRLLRISEGVDPLSYQFSTARTGPEFTELDGTTLPVLELDFGSVFESSLDGGVDQSAGTNEAGSLDSTSGSFTYIPGSVGGALFVRDAGGNLVEVTNGGTVQGQYGTLTITKGEGNTYNWVYELDGNIEHPDAENRDVGFDGSFEDDTLPDTFQFEVRAGDQVLAEGQLVITIGDDGPQASAGVQEEREADISLITDDSDLTGESGSSIDTGTFGNGVVFQVVWGADGPKMQPANPEQQEGPAGENGVGYSLTIGNTNSGLLDNETNEPIVLSLDENGNVVGTVQGTDLVVFTLSVDANGVVTLTQLRAIEHDAPGGEGGNGGDAVKYLANGIVGVTLTATDSDGDVDTATFDLGGRLGFGDDEPTACFPVELVFVEEESVPGAGGNNEGAQNYTATGSIVDRVTWGADGFGSVTGVTIGGIAVAVGQTVYFDANGNRIAYEPGSEGEGEGESQEPQVEPAASIVVNADGSYTVTVLGAMNHPAGWHENFLLLPKVEITAVDGDGDPITVDLYAKVQDDVPTDVSDIKIKLEEESVPGIGGNNETENPDLSYTANGSVQDHASWGADGFGSVLSVYAQTGLFSGTNYTPVNGTITVYFDEDGNVKPANATSGAAVLTIDASTGAYTLTVLTAMDHAKGNGENSLDLNDESWFHLQIKSLTIVAQDGDGDKVYIGLNASVRDDVPTLDVSIKEDADVPALLTQDAETIGQAFDTSSANFSGLFNTTASAGADGGTVKMGYSLSTTGWGASTGLTSDGNTIKLYESNGVIYGKTGGAFGTTIFSISVDGSGNVTLTQFRELDHTGENGDDDAFNNDKNLLNLADGLVKLTATGTLIDGDGDKVVDSATRNIGASIRFEDDLPSIDVKSSVAYQLKLTNIDAVSSAGYNNSFGYYVIENGKPVAGVVVWDNVKNFDTSTVTVTGYTPAQIGFFIIPNGDNFNSGLAANTPVTFVLQPNGTYQAYVGSTPLTGEGANVLFDNPAFNAGGTSYAQDNAYPGNLNWEDIANGGDRDFNDVNIQYTWGVNLPAIETQDADTVGDASDTAYAQFGTLFTTTFDMGADDDGSVSKVYSLSIGAGKEATGLTSNGQAITLSLEGGVIVGRTGAGDAGKVFSISVDANGKVTLTQFRELDHTGENSDGNSGNNSANLLGLVSGSVQLTLTATITDGDGDKASDAQTIDISSAFAFRDDLPTANNDNGGTVTEDGATSAVNGNVLGNDLSGADADKAFAGWGNNSAAVTELSKYGVLTLNSDGTWSYALDNTRAATQALGASFNQAFTLSYTMRDDDGDTKTANLTITVQGAADSASVTTAAAQGPDHTVYEDGLLSTGDTSETTAGSFAISATDGVLNVVVGGTTVTLAQLTSLGSTPVTIDTGEGTLKLTGYAGNGFGGTVSYTYTLKATIDNDSKPGATDTHFDDNVSVTVNGIGGTTATDTVSVRITDDTPNTPTAINATVAEGGQAKTNVMFILDVSGSMDSDGLPDAGTQTRLSIAKAAMENLINTYDSMGDVMVRIVLFNEGSSAVGGVWMTATQAKDWITDLANNAGDGLTNYDAALTTAMSAFGSDGKIPNGTNVSYFLSDGEPTAGSGSPSQNGPTAGTTGDIGIGRDDTPIGGEQGAWETFLKNNDIKSYALGMGTGVTVGAGALDDELDPIAYDGKAEVNIDPIAVTNLAQLSQVLTGTVAGAVTGNLLTQGGANFGADGAGTPKLFSVSFNGTEYTTASAQYNAGTSTLTLTVPSGTLTVNFATGDYSFASANVSADVLNAFTYKIVDADGDKAQGQLNITVKDSVPTANDDIATATEGYYTKGANQSYDASVTTQAATWTQNAAQNLGGVSNINNVDNGDSESDSSNTFSVSAADASHPTVVSFTIGLGDWNSADRWEALVYREQSGTDPVVASLTNQSGSGNFQLSITSPGTYYVTFRAFDNSGGSGRADLLISNLKYQTYSLTPATTVTIDIDAPTAVWSAPVNATGNVLANDVAGHDGGLVVAKVGTTDVLATNTVIAGTYGSLTIKADGTYTYVPNAQDFPAGTQEVFTYTVKDADGSTDDATLTINIGQYSYPTAGTGGSDLLFGSTGADSLSGGNGADRLVGNGGNDTLAGGDGTDILEGGAGDDNLQGGNHSDLLIGGAGNDLLAGGSGADVFQWKLGDQGNTFTPAEDHITDFNRGQGDKLDLRDLLQGENSGNISQYLSFSDDGAGHAVLSVSHQGNGEVTQKIVFDNMSLAQLQTAFADTAGATLVEKMKNAGAIDTN